MKKVLLALCVLMLVVSSASALTLNQGSMKMHLTDGTTLWTTQYGKLAPRMPATLHGATPSAPLPGFTYDGIQKGDESRSVLNVDMFEYLHPTPDMEIDDGVLTALVYDLFVHDYITSTDPLTGHNLVDIYFTGGVLEMYYDSTPESEMQLFDPLGDGKAPLQWDIDGADTNTYTNVNNAGDGATLWLSAAAMALGYDAADGTPITGVTTINLTLGTGANPLMYLAITGGSEAYMFDKGIGVTPPGMAYDLSMGYTVYNPNASEYYDYGASAGGWQLASDDPVHAFVIPEPATLTLLGLGIAGLGLARKRKKQ